MRRHRETIFGGLVMCVVVLMAGACALGPDDLPSPKAGTGAAYDVEFDFANALNLPKGANVTMDGLRVGEVRNITLTDKAVRVSARISDGTRIPTTSLATIRQDTVLGDTYVAIQRDPTSTGPVADLSAGGTVPISQTASPPQLEDTLAVLANFVVGGNIQKIETSIQKLNSVMPDLRDLQRLSSTVAGDLKDLAGRTDRIDSLISGLNDTATAVNGHQEQITEMLSPEGVVFWDRLSKQIIRHIGTLLPSIGSIFAGGIWLVPMLGAVDRALGATGLNVIDDEMMVATFVRDKLVPVLQHPSVNVQSVSTPDGQRVRDIENVLRMLGAAR